MINIISLSRPTMAKVTARYALRIASNSVEQTCALVTNLRVVFRTLNGGAR